MIIAPSILSADFAKLGEQVKECEKATTMIHYDVMDGTFVPNISFGPKILGDVKKETSLHLDVHLMIINPHNFIDEFVKNGADAITFHIEAYETKEEIIDCIKLIKKHGIDAGLAIKPATPVSDLADYLELIDLVMVMSVEPGFGGQSFMECSLPKLEELAKLKDKYNLRVAIDGGVNDKTFTLIKDTCLDFAVAGSYVFKQKDIAAAINSLK